MATNFIQPGQILTFIAPSGGVTSGTAVLIQGTVVIPTTSAAETLPFQGAIDGVFACPKATGATWTVGQTLYFDSADSTFKTAQSATARRAGIAASAQASGDASGNVKLLNIGAAANVA